MSFWSEYRLMNIMSNIDISLLEEDYPDTDVDDPVLFAEDRTARKKSRLALISGIAAGSVAAAGVIVYICRKHEVFRKAA